MAKLQPKFFTERPDRTDLSLYKDLIDEFNAKPAAFRHRTPYILFGKVGVERNTSKDPSVQFVPGVHMLPIGEAHGTEASIKRYLERGFVVLDYWLPEVGQVPPSVARGDVEVQSGWALDWSAKRRADLEKIIVMAKNQGDALYALKVKQTALESEKNTLAQKLAEAQAKMAEMEAARGQVSRGPKNG